MTNLLKVQ